MFSSVQLLSRVSVFCEYRFRLWVTIGSGFFGWVFKSQCSDLGFRSCVLSSSHSNLIRINGVVYCLQVTAFLIRDLVVL